MNNKRMKLSGLFAALAWLSFLIGLWQLFGGLELTPTRFVIMLIFFLMGVASSAIYGGGRTREI